MLVKRTSKGQFMLPKAFLQAAGITQPVHVVIEESISPKDIEHFETQALEIKTGDKVFQSRRAADKFLQDRLKK